MFTWLKFHSVCTKSVHRGQSAQLIASIWVLIEQDLHPATQDCTRVSMLQWTTCVWNGTISGSSCPLLPPLPLQFSHKPLTYPMCSRGKHQKTNQEQTPGNHIRSLYYKLEPGLTSPLTHRTVWWSSPELSSGQGFIGSGKQRVEMQTDAIKSNNTNVSVY